MENDFIGINKASGMRIYPEHIGTGEDSIAFGDGANDVEMMEFAFRPLLIISTPARIQRLP